MNETNIPVTVVDGPAALIVCRTQTSAEWRQEINRRLRDPQNPEGVQLRVLLDVVTHFEATRPGDVDKKATLHSALFYRAYGINSQLPRNCLIVGWLDAAGYRHTCTGMPVPSAEFLAGEWDRLLEFEKRYPTPQAL